MPQTFTNHSKIYGIKKCQKIFAYKLVEDSF